MVMKLEIGHDFIPKISKECNSTNNVDEVTVLVLYTSSDGGFYLY